VWDDTALIKAYDKAVASFKVRGAAPGAAGPWAGPLVCLRVLFFSFVFLKNALRNGECSEPSDKQEQQLGMKRKTRKKNRNRKKSNALPVRQVASPVNASDARTACCASLWCSKVAFLLP